MRYLWLSDMTEENVLNHQIANHSVIECDLCDYNCTDIKILEEHISDKTCLMAYWVRAG